MKTNLLIDFSAIWWRHWHATSDQDLNYAMQRTCDEVRHLAGKFDNTIVCLDGGHAHRTEIDPAYKANRDEKDAACVEQMRRCIDEVGRDLQLAKADGYEADDVIATLIKDSNEQFTIATADKDLAQLISDDVYILRTSSRDKEVVGADWVQEKFGVPPSKVGDWLALVGDKSDNIEGVRGCGPKTAAQLLEWFGDLGGIQRAWEAKDERLKPALRGALQSAISEGTLDRARQLVTLVDEAPVKFFRTEAEASESDGGFVSEQEEVEDVVAEVVQEVPAPPKSDEHVVRPPQQALTTTAPVDFSMGLQPNRLEDAYRVAKYAVASRLFTAYGSPEAAFSVIMAGRELGIGAMTALRTFHVVEGKPTMSAQLMMGLCQRSSKCEYFQPVSVTSTSAKYVTKRVGNQIPTEWEYTWEDAERAGLVNKNNWKKHPKLMLMNRCISELARAVYPDIVANLYTADEISQGQIDNEVAA